MAGYPWTVTVSPTTIDEVTITAGTTTETVTCGEIVPTILGDGDWGFTTSAFPETTEVTLSATGYNDVTAIVGTTSSVTFTEAGYSWVFSAPASPITITDGTNTYTYTGTAIPLGGYSYTVTDFNENDEVTISAVGYNRVTATVGDATIVMTEMPEVEVLNPNGTSYAIADAKARQQVAGLETNVYNDLQNYVTTGTAQTISGEKTLTDELFISMTGTDFIAAIQQAITLGSAPASNVGSGYTIFDSNNDWAAAFKHVYESGGLVKSQMLVRRQDKSASTRIEVGFKANGDEFTRAPACSDTNSIVTTTGMNKDTNGYVKLGNGIIVQWGDHSTTSAGASTITFPTAFTDNNYSITFTRISGSSTTNESGSYYFRGRTTTSVGVYKTSNNTQSMMWIAIGY